VSSLERSAQTVWLVVLLAPWALAASWLVLEEAQLAPATVLQAAAGLLVVVERLGPLLIAGNAQLGALASAAEAAAD